MIVRIAATPVAESDGPRLADEVLAAIAAVTREDDDIEIAHDGANGAAASARERRLDGERDGYRREPVTQEYES